jgi:hypothetical protein
MDAFRGSFLAGTRVFIDRSLGNPDTEGCFIATDHSNPNNNNVANFLQVGFAGAGTGNNTNSWHTRFSGGYDFWTDANSTVGIRINPGTSTVSPICDARLKQDMVEYTDSASILQRVVECPVVTYHHKSAMIDDPVKESAMFRITPTAQAFHRVFHPEDGTEAEQIQKQNEDGKEIMENCLTKQFIEGLVRKGELASIDDSLSNDQKIALFDFIDSEMAAPSADCERKMQKMTLATLNYEEIIAGLMLSIKELDKQVKLLQARCDELENP